MFGKHSVRAWALGAVAAMSAFMMFINVWHVRNLAAADWCNRAVGATKYSEGRPEFAVGGCFQLMTKQLEALAINSYISNGTLALCLAVLVVIVLAGGRVSGRADREGVSLDISSDKAAQEVADAAQIEADEIKGSKSDG